MYLLVLFFPFISFFSILLVGRYFGSIWAAYLSISCLTLTFLCSLFIFYEVGFSSSMCIITLNSWIQFAMVDLSWAFMFDSIGAVMLVVVSLISGLVHLYSYDYMRDDPHLSRFMAYLSLFTWFMLLLITAGTFVQIFLAWEGVGLSSYLLISFWFTRLEANKAAMKAIIINRVGDFALYTAIILVFLIFKSFNLQIVFTLLSDLPDKSLWILEFIAGFLFVGAMGKSSQIGLHTWLPDAMEGPTPVSALIHAATMVTAGIFLIIRCSPIFVLAPNTLIIVTFIGALTAFISASIGIFQMDIKKIIAYSTCSQLGYMVIACGLGAFNLALFHLFNHAFFKALLFLCSGSVIHAVGDEQDIRRMGGLHYLLPVTYNCMVIASLALAGIPFLTGFYSKDFILALASTSGTTISMFSFILGTMAVFCTAFYSIRLLIYVFFRFPNFTFKNVHESPFGTLVVLVGLSMLSIFIGFLTKDLFIGEGTFFWVSSIALNPSSLLGAIIECDISLIYKLSPFFVSMGGLLVSLLYYHCSLTIGPISTLVYIYIYRFFNQKWYFDIIYNNYISGPLLNFSYKISFKLLDRGLLEYWGPLGLVHMIKHVAYIVSWLASGFLHHYILCIILFVISFLIFLIFPYSLVLLAPIIILLYRAI